MVIPVDYVNGIVVLPGFQILITRHAPIQEPTFIDDYETTFQREMGEYENKLQCLVKEANNVLGINLARPSTSNYIQLLKFGTFPGPYARSTVTLFFLKIINTTTFKVGKDYEVRTLSFDEAFNEMLCPLINGYHDIPLEYTNVAEHVLQRIHSYGGIIKCIKDSF